MAERVAGYVQAALNELPPRFAERISNVSFVVRRVPSPEEHRRLHLRGSLYGLYEGIPLTRRASGYDRALPDRITVFWGTLQRDFPEEAALAAQVRKTVLHEIGHYFGMSEAELRRSALHH